MNTASILRKVALSAVTVAAMISITGCQCGKCNEPPQPKKKITRTTTKPKVEKRVVKKVQERGYVKLETHYPDEVVVGQPYKYNIVVTNLIPESAITDVVVEQELSDGFEFIDSNPKGNLDKGRNVVTWDLGTINPNNSAFISVEGRATREGSIINCTKIDYRRIVCETVSAIAPKLEITKTMPAKVYRCQSIPVKLVVSNTGTGTLKNVKITDKVPAGLKPEAGTNLSWSISELKQGQSKVIHYKLQPTQNGEFENMAEAKADGGLKSSDKATVTVIQPKLKITKTGPKKVFMGRAINYTIMVKNTGDAIAKKLVVTDPIPGSARFVGASDGGRAVNKIITWELPDLAPGASQKVEATLVSNKAETLKNVTKAEAYCTEPVMASVSTKVLGVPAILLEVIDVTDPIEVGDTVTYIITATNQGSATGTNIKIACNLEDSQEFVSATGATKENVRGQKVKFAPLSSLAPKKRAVWRVTVKALEADDVRFKVEMTSDQLKRPVEETEATNQY